MRLPVVLAALFMTYMIILAPVAFVSAVVPSQNLSLFLPFNETSGKTARDWGSDAFANNFTLYNSANFANISGYYGLNMTGSTSQNDMAALNYPNMSGLLVNQSTNYTWTMVIYARGATSSQYVICSDADCGIGGISGYHIYVQNNKICFAALGSGGSCAANIVFQNNTWTWIAWVRNSSGIYGFINGSFAGTGGFGSDTVSNVTLWRFGVRDFGNAFNGSVRLFRFWSGKALNATELNDTYTQDFLATGGGGGSNGTAPTGSTTILNLSYDLNGNLITAGDGKFREYNSLNQLVRIYNGSSNASTLLESYDYHPTEERILTKRIYNSTGAVISTTIYFSKTFVRVVNSSGSFDSTYLYHNGQLIAQRNPDGTKIYIHGDNKGTSTVITNQTGGVLEASAYDPYGGTLTGGTKTRYGFEAKEADTLVGDTDFHFRKYLPQYGIFAQPDTTIQDVYNPQTLNRYSFEHNSPHNYKDNDGHFAILVALGIAAAVGAVVGAVTSVYNQVSSGTKVSQINWGDVGKSAAIGAGVGVAVTLAAVAIAAAAPSVAAAAVGLSAAGVHVAGPEVFSGTSGAASSGGLQALSNIFFGRPASQNVGAAAQSGYVGGLTGAAAGSAASTFTEYCQVQSIRSSPAVQQTTSRIQSGGPFPYSRDGTTFFNREGLLPSRPENYYSEYTVPTEGVEGRGPQRIVAGTGGELYYSADHYQSFTQIS